MVMEVNPRRTILEIVSDLPLERLCLDSFMNQGFTGNFMADQGISVARQLGGQFAEQQKEKAGIRGQWLSIMKYF